MIFKILFSVILGALLASLAWNRVLSRQLEKSEPTPAASLALAMAPEKSPVLPTTPFPRSTAPTQAGGDYAAEKALLDSLIREYRVANNRGLPGNEAINELELRLTRRRAELNDVTLRIQATQAQEAALPSPERSAAAPRNEPTELNARIRQQEQAIRSTQQQLREANQAKFDFAAHERIAPLTQQLTDQRAMLQRLRDLRPQGAQTAARGQSAHLEAQDQLRRRRESLRESLEILQHSAHDIQADILELQRQAQAARNQAGTARKELSDLKTRLDDQRTRVQSLRATGAQ